MSRTNLVFPNQQEREDGHYASAYSQDDFGEPIHAHLLLTAPTVAKDKAFF